MSIFVWVSEDITVECAFQYVNEFHENVLGFCNNIYNAEGGTHQGKLLFGEHIRLSLLLRLSNLGSLLCAGDHIFKNIDIPVKIARHFVDRQGFKQK